MQALEESWDYREGVQRRATSLLRALVRCGFFGPKLPPTEDLIAMTRIPRIAFEEALAQLAHEDLIASKGSSWECHAFPATRPMAAFFINNSLILNCYGVIQDYFIGFEDAMFQAGYETYFRGDFTNFPNKLATLKKFRDDGGKGVALAGFAEPRIRQWVLENKFPAVVVGNATIHQQDIGRVCTDNVGGMEQMVRHLISEGHRDLGYYTVGLDTHHGFQERAYGYTSTMEESGLMPVTDLMFKGPHDPECAHRAAVLFSEMPVRPTVIICASDREAFELITELRALEINIPKEVSIVGFDNNLYGLITDPPLTSIEIYAEQMGQMAATYLMGEIQAPQMPVNMVLPTKLVARYSVIPRGTAVATALAERAKKTDKIRSLQGH